MDNIRAGKRRIRRIPSHHRQYILGMAAWQIIAAFGAPTASRSRARAHSAKRQEIDVGTTRQKRRVDSPKTASLAIDSATVFLIP